MITIYVYLYPSYIYIIYIYIYVFFVSVSYTYTSIFSYPLLLSSKLIVIFSKSSSYIKKNFQIFFQGLSGLARSLKFDASNSTSNLWRGHLKQCESCSFLWPCWFFGWCGSCFCKFGWRRWLLSRGQLLPLLWLAPHQVLRLRPLLRLPRPVVLLTPQQVLQLFFASGVCGDIAAVPCPPHAPGAKPADGKTHSWKLAFPYHVSRKDSKN